MSTLIEVPLWHLLILIIVAWPGASYLGRLLGMKIIGPILMLVYLFFIGQKVYGIDEEGNKTFIRLRWFRSIQVFLIIRQIERKVKDLKNERS